MGYAATTADHGMFQWDLDEVRKEITDALGDYSGVEIWGNQVLLAVVCAPVETKGGFLVGNEKPIEDVWQGKCGLILAIGPDCFTEDAKTFNGRKPQVGDFVYHNINEQTLQMSVYGPGSKMAKIKNPRGEMEDKRTWKGWPCRLVQDRFIYGRVTSPELVL